LVTTPLLAKWPPGKGEEVFSLHALRLQVGLEGAAGAVYRFPLSLTIATIGVALFGAAGGFLSALLQVHGSRVAAGEYRESKHTLLLRPIIGAVIALILFILLSWNVVPGVRITGTGTYLLLAMLSGFSERYFLRLLDLDDDNAGRRDTKAPLGAARPGSSPPKHTDGTLRL
jgi:hypothetical protein